MTAPQLFHCSSDVDVKKSRAALLSPSRAKLGVDNRHDERHLKMREIEFETHVTLSSSVEEFDGRRVFSVHHRTESARNARCFALLVVSRNITGTKKLMLRREQPECTGKQNFSGYFNLKH